ncbi:hypothetical protein AAGT00_16525 [Streptomyces cavourensis]
MDVSWVELLGMASGAVTLLTANYVDNPRAVFGKLFRDGSLAEQKKAVDLYDEWEKRIEEAEYGRAVTGGGLDIDIAVDRLYPARDKELHTYLADFAAKHPRIIPELAEMSRLFEQKKAEREIKQKADRGSVNAGDNAKIKVENHFHGSTTAEG